MRIWILSVFAALTVVGCGPKAEVATDPNVVAPANESGSGGESGKGLEINWPGGSVKIGGDGGVDVKAPGVDVNTKPGEGVKVKAGDVDVDVDLKDDREAGAEPGADQANGGIASEHVVTFRPRTEMPGFSSQKKTLDRIPPGVRFKDSAPSGWTNLISFVEGQLDSGDVDAVSDMVSHYAKVFNLVKLANVVRDNNGGYELDKVAIGFSMKIDGLNTVVTSDTQKKLGGDLGMIARGVLDGNVESLEKVEQIARNRTSMLIDAPAIMLRGNEHLEMVVRYFIWVSPSNGQLGTVVWLLDSDPKNGATEKSYVLAENEIQYLPPTLFEQRSMNVKADRFNILGIPKKDAFALVRIPQGRGYSYTDELRQVAGLRTYSEADYAEFLSAMAKTLASK